MRSPRRPHFPRATTFSLRQQGRRRLSSCRALGAWPPSTPEAAATTLAAGERDLRPGSRGRSPRASTTARPSRRSARPSPRPPPWRYRALATSSATSARRRFPLRSTALAGARWSPSGASVSTPQRRSLSCRGHACPPPPPATTAPQAAMSVRMGRDRWPCTSMRRRRTTTTPTLLSRMPRPIGGSADKALPRRPHQRPHQRPRGRRRP
mmetsp:Transcript_9790/g.24671  ORF Transcript_9790/g.24671 Transcript_9790/m.24671 type:complete len:209 (+) Transcript_9790:108-734(+)